MFWLTYLCTVTAGLTLVLIRRILKKIVRLGARTVRFIVITAKSWLAEDIFIARPKPSILK